MPRAIRPSVFAIIVIAAVVLRLWDIGNLPPGFHFDESFEGVEAWRILTDPAYRPVFLTGNFGVPPLNAYANAITFALFEFLGSDAGPTAMRMTAAIFGILGVLALFALAYELRNLDYPQAQMSVVFPALAAASLAVMRWHVHFSRMGIEPIMVPAAWAGTTWLFLRGWRTGSWWAFVGSGIILAGGMYAYQAAWVIPLLMIAVVLHLLLYEHLYIRRTGRKGARSLQHATESGQRRRLIGIVLTALVAVLLVVPLAWFFWQNPTLLLLRPTQLAIVGETGSPADSTLGHNLWATAKMFGPLGMPGDLDPRRNLPGDPALNVWQAFPFYLGLAIALWRIWRPAYAIPLLGLAGLLLPGVFSEYAPHFHRILGATAPAALLCGIGLDWLWQHFARRMPGSIPQARRLSLPTAQWIGRGAVIFLIVAAAMTTTRDYFVRWASLPDLFYAFDDGLWQLGQWVNSQESGSPIYITPRGEGHPTLAFAWRRSENTTSSQPISFDGRAIFPLTRGPAPIAEHYAVIEHEDFRTRLLLPEIFPNAIIGYEVSDMGGQVYARVYTRPPNSIPARAPGIEQEAVLGDGITLQGYDVQPTPVHSGGVLYVQLHWLVEDVPADNWTVFTHLTDRQTGNVVAGHDSPPGGGSLPTWRWQPGWRVLDEYQIPLPPNLTPGEYDLRTGLYQSTGEQLPASGVGIELGVVKVE